jgi:nucleoid-associated protein YgaU
MPLGAKLNTNQGVSGFIKNPFNKSVAFKRADDFTEGFLIEEISQDPKGKSSTIRLVGNQMPKVPFTFGGEQQISKEYYPGNPEANVQVLGARENDITINGRLYAKRFRERELSADSLPSEAQSLSNEDMYKIPEAIRDEIDNIRQRGNIVKIRLGTWERYCVIQSTEWNIKLLADLEYSITFSIISIKAPSRCPIIETAKILPIDAQASLLAQAEELENDRQNNIVPSTVPTSLSELIDDVTSTIAEAVNVVTDFVDNVISTGEDITNSINRAVGIVKNAKSTIFRAKLRLASISYGLDFAGINTGDRFKASKIVSGRISRTADINSFLTQLQQKFASLAITVPIARHKVIDGDTLQNISVKFYGNSGNWNNIYKHNKLTTTVLQRGSILEIPKL